MRIDDGIIYGNFHEIIRMHKFMISMFYGLLFIAILSKDILFILAITLVSIFFMIETDDRIKEAYSKAFKEKIRG